MEKRYQVFVSSTYEDLQEERKEVMQALLELDCIPAGMELFPAANEDQWTLIRQVIDTCDYYLVIVGGRYGSLGSDGIGYTEKEYQYAMETGVPTIGFLHKNPDELPAKNTEQAEKDKLEAFRTLVKSKMCQFWDSPSDLGSKVSRSLVKLIKNYPAVGWVRADELPSEDVNQELLSLRKRVDDLQYELAQAQTSAPKGTEDFSQGDDLFELQFTFVRSSNRFEEIQGKSSFTWDEIFYAASPIMIDEASDDNIRSVLEQAIEEKVGDNLSKRFDYDKISKFRVITSYFHTIIVQLRALGLITKSVKTRSVKDTNTYWKLTPYGENVMTKIRAIRRK